MSSTVKRFILLGGKTHYACGGFHDFISSHDSLQSAVVEANLALVATMKSGRLIDWFHVWDCKESNVVACSLSQAYGAPDETPAMEEQSHA